ncbi:MAG: hypothetical protein AAGG57_08580 [Pseudomonadota bacterium]
MSFFDRLSIADRSFCACSGADPLQNAVATQMVDLDRWAVRLLHSIRLFREGPAGQATVWNDFALYLSPGTANAEMQAFETLISRLGVGELGPFQMHASGCRSISTDELLLVNLVTLSVKADQAGAKLLAAMITRFEYTERLVQLAARVGTSIRRIEGALRDAMGQAGTKIVQLH